MIENVLKLIRKGFHVFPVIPGDKKPMWMGSFHKAVSTEEEARRLWVLPDGSDSDMNIGVATGRFGKGQHLVVIDIDKKNNKDGFATLLELEIEGYTLPATYRVRTASGSSEHYYYISTRKYKSGAGVLGVGIDIRADGGYVVGEGSRTPDGVYEVINDVPIAMLPEWVEQRLKQASEMAPKKAPVPGASHANAVPAKLKNEYAESLLGHYPPAVEGQGGNEHTYKLVCMLKDYGLSDTESFNAIKESGWNDKCLPPWSDDELYTIINNAFSYGVKVQGAAIDEAVEGLKAIYHPEEEADLIRDMNRKYAIALWGNSTKVFRLDTEGHKDAVFNSTGDFTTWMMNVNILVPGGMSGGDKLVNGAKHWLQHPDRRQFDKVIFDPSPKNHGPKVYNLFTGFNSKAESFDEASPAARNALKAFEEHIFENVAMGSQDHFNWLMTWMAHKFQRPHIKTDVLLALTGKKGTGKSIIPAILKELLGDMMVSFSNSQAFMDRFNVWMETALLINLEESFWDNNKAYENQLKNYITCRYIEVEQKFGGKYSVRNYSDFIFTSNYDKVFPASVDERRLAAFSVGTGWMQRREKFAPLEPFFKDGKLDNGILLGHFLDWDLNKANIHVAPDTDALRKQKELFMPTEDRFIRHLMTEGLFIHYLDGRKLNDGSNITRVVVDKDRLYEDYLKYCVDEGHKWYLAKNAFTHFLLRILRNAKSISMRTGKSILRVVAVPTEQLSIADSFKYEIRPRYEEDSGLKLDEASIIEVEPSDIERQIEGLFQ